MKPASILKVCFLAVAVIVAGCSIFSTPVEKQEKAEKKVAASDKSLVTEAQKEMAVGLYVLKAAPKSKPVDISTFAFTRADSLLGQANGPLPAEAVSAQLKIAEGLLSEEQKKRAAAEYALAVQREDADELSAENATLKKQLAEAVEATKAWAIERDATAKKWERLWFWIWVAAGVYGASVILPVVASVFSGGAAGPVLGLVSKAVGYIASPAIQFAKDRAVGGLVKVGHALEDFRQDAPQVAAKLTRTFDSYTDADHQREIGAAARDFRASLPPVSLRRTTEKTQQDPAALTA